MRIREIRPNISITTDIIVGFPGETEENFLETLEFAKKVEFSKIHVFPFSVRRGTKAETMDNHVSETIKHERVKRLVNLSLELEHKYLEKFVGEVLEVLVETNDETSSIGHTDNYLKVRVLGKFPSNSFIKVKINNLDNLVLEGSLYEESK